MSHSPKAVHVQVLSNGLTAVIIPRPHAAVVFCGVDVRVGSRFETPGTAGLTHFLEHMLFQGCVDYPDAETINRAAEGIGAELDASTGRESTRFDHWCLPEHLEASLSLLAALVSRPLFESIEAERAVILEEALDEVDEDGRLIDPDILSRRDLWPRSAMGWSVIGPRKNIRGFAEGALRAHHRAHFVPAGMVVSVVGPVEVEAARGALEGAFGSLSPGARVEVPALGPPPAGPRLRYVRDPRSQAELRAVFRTPGDLDPDAAAIHLLKLALDGGMASRLQIRLGTELGLAYDLWATWEQYPDTGAFEIGATVSPGKVATFYEEVHRLLMGLSADPPRGEELEHLRFRARWSIIQSLDEADTLALIFGSRRLYETDPPPPERILAQINAITPDDLARVAQRIFRREGYVTCVVGHLGRGQRKLLTERVHAFGR